MKMAVVGTGYVGLSNAMLLAQQHHEVVALDVVAEKVALLNAGKSLVVDKEIEAFLSHEELAITIHFEGKGLEEKGIIASVDGDKAPALNVGDVITRDVC